MTSAIRKFGTDLSNDEKFLETSSELNHHRSAHKLKKMTSPVMMSVGPMNGSYIVSPSDSISDKRKKDYSVHFTAGPLGMQLEPVVKSIMGRDLGCKVVAFVDEVCFPQMRASQARLANVIGIGDVLVAIDGKQILSKSYSDIISLLKSTSGKGGRTITFRRVTENENLGSPYILNLSEEIRDDRSSSQSLCTAGFRENDEGRDVSTDDMSVLTTPTIDRKTDHDKLFSPSNVKRTVKKMSNKVSPIRNTVIKDISKEISSEPKVTRTLDHIVRGILPIAGTAGSFASHIVYKAGKHASIKAGECLVGHSSKEFDNAVRLKHELLTELSCTKAALGQEQMNIVTLQETIEKLAKQNVDLNKNFDQCRASKSLLENNLSIVRDDLCSANTRLKQLEQQLRDSALSREKLTNDIVLSEERLDVSRLETLECRTEIGRLKQDYEMLKNENVDFKNQNEFLTLECKTLRKQLEQTEKNSHDSKQFADKIIQELTDRCNDIEQTKGNCIENLKTDLTKATVDLEKSQVRIKEILASSEKTLKDQEVKFSNEILSLENELKMEKEAKACAVAEVGELRMTSQLIDVAMNELKTKLSQSEKSLSESERLRESIRTENSGALETLQKRYEQKIEDLQMSLDNEKSKSKVAAEELLMLRGSIEDLECAKMSSNVLLNTEKIQNESMVNELEELRAKYSALQLSHETMEKSINSLQNALLHEKNEKEKVLKQFENNQKSLENAEVTIQDLKPKLALAEMKLLDANKTIHRISEQKSQFEEEITEVKSSFDLEKLNNSIMEEKLDDLRRTNKHLDERVNTLVDSLKHEKNEHLQTLAKLDENRDSLILAQNSLIRLENQFSETEAKLNQAEKTNARLSAEVEKAFQSMKAENEKTNCKLQTSICSENLTKENTRNELAYFHKLFQDQLSYKDNTIESLNEALKNENNKLNIAIARNQTLQSELDRAQKSQSEADENLSKISMTFEQIRESKANENIILSTMEEKYSLLLGRNEDLLHENRKLQKALNFQERFDELVAEVDDLVANFDPQVLNNLRLAKDRLFNQNQELSLQVKDLKQSLADNNRSLESVRYDLEECNDALSKSQIQERTLSNNLRQLKSEIQDTEKRTYEALNIIDERERTISNLNEQLESYEIQLRQNERDLEKVELEAKTTVENLNIELSTVRQNLAEKGESFHNEIHKLQREMVKSLNDGESQLSITLMEKEKLREHNDKLQRDIEQSFSKICSLEKQVLVMKESEELHIKSIDVLKKERNQQINRIDELMKENCSNIHNIDHLELEKEKMLAGCEEKVHAALKKSQDYECKMKEVQQSLVENESKISSLHSIIRSLEDEKDKLQSDLIKVQAERDDFRFRLDEEIRKASSSTPNEELVNEMANQLNQTRRKLLELKRELHNHGMIPNMVESKK